MDPSAPVGGAAPFTVLFVCTGNICRSPLAERVARARLDERYGAGAAHLRVGSAGTRATAGRRMDPASAAVLRELGGDPAGFGSRPLTGALAAAADLTLTMTRAHRSDVLGRAPRALSRTFTLREAAGLLGTLPDGPPAEGPPEEAARALVAQLAAARARRPGGPDDDVRDPIGQPAEVHAEVGRAIADALTPLLDRLVPVPAPH